MKKQRKEEVEEIIYIINERKPCPFVDKTEKLESYVTERHTHNGIQFCWADNVPYEIENSYLAYGDIEMSWITARYYKGIDIDYNKFLETPYSSRYD